MKVHVNILETKTIYEIPNAWSNEDYANILEELNFPDAKESKPEELFDLLSMAVTDFEPNEVAEKVLQYRLGEQLNEGQIEQIAHDMLVDKIAEEYPKIELHEELFNVNQLLFKAYNGKFPKTAATKLKVEVTSKEDLDEELLLKALADGLKESALIKRLFPDQIAGEEEWISAKDILWTMRKEGNIFTIITSEYWLDESDFEKIEYDAELHVYEPEED